MYDLSILIPAIRTPNWKNVVESLLKHACKKYTTEIVFVSPFDLPDELKGLKNIRVIKSLASIPCAVQMAVPLLKSEMVFMTVDDAYFQENSVDLAMDLYKNNCSYKDIISCIYGEGRESNAGNLLDSKFSSVI